MSTVKWSQHEEYNMVYCQQRAFHFIYIMYTYINFLVYIEALKICSLAFDYSLFDIVQILKYVVRRHVNSLNELN